MTLKEIKHLFMAYRNGIVADALRQAGMPYEIIFGLQIPQLGDIARRAGKDDNLASALWNDRKVRESRLLACWLFDERSIDMDRALQLANDVRTNEEADILCFRLLRKLDFAPEVALRLFADGRPAVQYCGKALQRNLEAKR